MEYFPPLEPETDVPESGPEPVVPDVPESGPEVEPQPEPTPEPEPVVAPSPAPVGLTQEQAYASSLDPSTPSPFKPTPGVCGHCGNGATVENQGSFYLCHACGKWSNLDGTPTTSPHARANMSDTFAWANKL